MELGNACSAFHDGEIDELKDIARIYIEAGNVVEKIASSIGAFLQKRGPKLPGKVEEITEDAVDFGLRMSYWAAEATQSAGDPESWRDYFASKLNGEQSHKIAAAVSGVVGGFGGIGTVAVDLAASTTIILRSVQQIARDYGEDIASEEVRLQCLSVFGFGGPLVEDDEAETGFYSLRLATNGKALAEMLKLILPRFSIVVTEKVLAQAAPVLGSMMGAFINSSFAKYYQQMAHVHFRLRRLEKTHDPEAVGACFERVVRVRRESQKPLKRKRT